jgi:wyosine [tRNA(Phe)-imidazoG37] synthetase (radical SAM superfamily)
MITFGPVPSRRLGRSLGINNIPPKACTYSCVYCQVGPTHRREIEPRSFYAHDQILSDVKTSVEAAYQAGESIDYLTFVPDGEPTLDENLGRTIELLRPFGLKIAVISNASLIWREDVRERLAGADWLSLKVDSTDENLWRRINQPHPDLHLQKILEGIQLMGATFQGELTTETMLVDGINDSVEAITGVSEYLAQLNPDKAYLAAPIRPAAEVGICPPTEEKINRAFQILSKEVSQAEYLIGYEGNAFASTGCVVDDLLNITSVHPMREEAIKALLAKTGNDWGIVMTLINEGRLKETEYEGKRFYVRALRQSKDD